MPSFLTATKTVSGDGKINTWHDWIIDNKALGAHDFWKAAKGVSFETNSSKRF